MKKIIVLCIIFPLLFGLLFSFVYRRNKDEVIKKADEANPPTSCLIDNQGMFEPCKLLVVFSSATKKNTIEETNQSLLSLVKSMGFSNAQIIYADEGQLPQAILTLPSNDVLAIGNSLQQKYPQYILSYTEIKKPVNQEQVIY